LLVHTQVQLWSARVGTDRQLLMAGGIGCASGRDSCLPIPEDTRSRPPEVRSRSDRQDR